MRGFSVACCSPQMQACAGHHVCDGECMKLAGGVWVKGSGREEGGYLLLLPVFSCLSQVQFSHVAAACFLSFFLCYLPALAERACLSSHPPISGIDRGGVFPSAWVNWRRLSYHLQVIESCLPALFLVSRSVYRSVFHVRHSYITFHSRGQSRFPMSSLPRWE